MEAVCIAPNLWTLDGAVTTGVLVSGRKALLFDCCDTVTPDRLAALGVASVDRILFTQHRRPNTAGVYPFSEAGAQAVAPAGELALFEHPEAHWTDPKNRWHLYHHQPGPLVPARAIPVARAVRENDVVDWEGHSIRVLDTPGATDGSVSYLLEIAGRRIVFSGDVLFAPGELWDLSSLQKGNGMIGDYHGFIGNRARLIPSLKKLAACGADLIVPSHGEPTADVRKAIELTLERLDMLWRNYTAISSLNHYFPTLFDDTKDDPLRMKPARTSAPPRFVRRVIDPSFAVISETKAALLVDCGHPSMIDKLREWLAQGTIKSVDACWVTHYHDDHVNALAQLRTTLGCPIVTDWHMAEILEAPRRFCLPCISPDAVPVARRTREGESWRWQEFTLSAFHFPGQSFYHSGLLVEGHGTKVFFAGDSGAPTGIDDHCCPNRNFLGKGRGFRRCIELWRRLRPDYIFNQHQDMAFAFTDAELDYMDAMLGQREKLLSELLPWAHPDFGTDELWVRAYPYEQDAKPGDRIAVDVQFTNHGPDAVTASVEPVLPEPWKSDEGSCSVIVPPRTDGLVGEFCERPDRAARVEFAVPESELPGLHVIPFRVTWGDRYLGQFRHAIVVVS